MNISPVNDKLLAYSPAEDLFEYSILRARPTRTPGTTVYHVSSRCMQASLHPETEAGAGDHSDTHGHAQAAWRLEGAFTLYRPYARYF